ncbi:OMP_b-brl domain-containing protein [Vibrio chagasii]|nr:OMP_b-brl domain-containing protein [Vibrio chagasii]
MKKMIIASLAILSTSAFAANEMYALGGIGYEVDAEETGVQFTFGSQILDTNFYVESTLNYIDSDDGYAYPNGNSQDVDYQNFKMSLSPMYKHSFNESFAIYGKIGVAYSNLNSKTKTTIDDVTETRNYSNSRWGAAYGFGAEYKSGQPVIGNSKFIARLGYDWYDFNSGSSEGTLGMQAGLTF